MKVSRPVISRAESPTQPIPSDEVLTAWSGTTGVPVDQLTELAQQCKSGSPEWFMPYLAAESGATVLRSWAPLIVPGLLQTEAYAREVLGVDPYSPERITELAAARMERKAVLDRAYLTAIIDCTVLERCIGDASVMAEQCSYLVAVAEFPNVSLHILPPEGANHGAWGALDIASNGGLVTVNRTTATTDVTTTAAIEIEQAMATYERVLGYALAPRPSLDFIRTKEDMWKTQV